MSDKKFKRRKARHNANLLAAINEERICEVIINRESGDIDTLMGVENWGPISPKVVDNLVRLCEDRIDSTKIDWYKATERRKKLELDNYLYI